MMNKFKIGDNVLIDNNPIGISKGIVTHIINGAFNTEYVVRIGMFPVLYQEHELILSYDYYKPIS